jgi:hypothetical protein
MRLDAVRKELPASIDEEQLWRSLNHLIAEQRIIMDTAGYFSIT